MTKNANFTNESTSLKLFTGYEFDDYLAIESELLTVGDVVATENGIANKLFDVSSLTVIGVIGKDITDNIRLFTKLGGHLWTVDDDSKSDKPLDSAVDFTYGAGVEVNLYGDKNRQLRAQVNRYNFDDVYLHSGYIASVDIIFYFGLPTNK